MSSISVSDVEEITASTLTNTPNRAPSRSSTAQENESVTSLDAIDHRDCRNVNSVYKLQNEHPPCHRHPTGILMYQYHSAYDELFKEKPSRLIASVVLLGYKDKPLFEYLRKHIDKYLDNHRDEFLGLDLNSPEAQVPFSNLRQVILDWASGKRSDPDWRLKEDEVYVDLALDTVAIESHRIWDTRPEQSGGRNMRRKHFGGPRSVPFDSQSYGSIFQSNVALKGPPLGATLSTAIGVDEDEARAKNSFGTPSARSATMSSRYWQATPLEALASPNYLKVPANLNIENLAEVQKAFFRLQHENKQKEKVIARLNETVLQQRQAGSRAEADRDQLNSDNAVLGIALAETLKIRKGSQTAIVSLMAKQASLPQDLTERLMQNRAFTNRWFPNAAIGYR